MLSQDFLVKLLVGFGASLETNRQMQSQTQNKKMQRRKQVTSKVARTVQTVMNWRAIRVWGASQGRILLEGFAFTLGTLRVERLRNWTL